MLLTITEKKLGPSLKHQRNAVQLEVGVVAQPPPSAHWEDFIYLLLIFACANQLFGFPMVPPVASPSFSTHAHEPDQAVPGVQSDRHSSAAPTLVMAILHTLSVQGTAGY